MSSSEEDTSQFSECVYNVIQSKTGKDVEKLPSNRVLPEEQKLYDPKNLKVSAAFQKHVSKHLEALLDDTKFVDVGSLKNKKKKVKRKCESGGLVLLSSNGGDVIVTGVDDAKVEGGIKVKKKKRRHEVDEKELLRRAKEVAVTPEYILGKEEPKSWAPENKGVVEIVQI